MAIGEKYPGIEAVVLVGGEKAQEYKHDNVFGELDNISRYIESKDDTEFSIRLLKEEYKFAQGKHDALGIKVFVDGVKMCTSIWNENRPNDYMYLTGRKIKNRNGTISVALFKFVAINIVDGEDRDAANLQREQTKNTGKIVVEVSRCRVNAMFKGMAKDTDKELETSPSKMMLKAAAGRKLTHRTDFGEKVAKSNTAVKYNVTEIDTAGPIARFVFYYRAKDVLEDLKVEKIDESLSPPLRYQGGMFVEQDLTQTKTKTAPKIKTEADTTQDSNIGDAYGATPPPLQRQIQVAPTQVPADNDAILQALLGTISEEQKRNMIQLLTQGNAAQTPQAPRPAQAAAVPAHDPVKQEHSPLESRRGSRLSIEVSSRKTYDEHLGDGCDIIDLSTPVEETFIKPDPDADVQVPNNDNDVVMDGQAEADAASSSALSDSSPVAHRTETVQVEVHAASSSLRARRIEAESQAAAATAPPTGNAISEITDTAQGSMSTADGIVTPKTPVQKEGPVSAEETPVYNVENNGVIMDIGKPTSPESVALGCEADAMAASVMKVADSVGTDADIIASIEAADYISSSAATVGGRSPSDAFMGLNKALNEQHKRSSRPTVATISKVAQDRSEAMSPTPQSGSIMAANTRTASISSEAGPVQTTDADMETGYDAHKGDAEEDGDYGSPSRQLMRESTEDDGFEMIEKPAQVSEITAAEITDSAIASVAVGKLVKTFEEARAAALAKKQADNKPAERAEPVQVVDKPTAGFEEAIRAVSSPANKPFKSPTGVTTAFPVVEPQVEIPNTPISAKKSSPVKQAEGYTVNQEFIDLETIIPQTPVKNTTPVGLIKNASVTTPTSTKATPNTVDRQLSAAGKGMAGLYLNNNPRRSLFGKSTPRSTASVGSDAPITGNAGSGHAGAKKSTPIKRERVDGRENYVYVVETDGTPSKKMKYLSLGSQDAPISFDTDDDELPEEPKQAAEEPPQTDVVQVVGQVATSEIAQDELFAQTEKEKSCCMM